MNKLVFLLVTCILTLQAIGQNKEEKEVAAAVDQLKMAMIDGERAKLESITDDHLSYGHSSGVVEDKKTFVEHIEWEVRFCLD